MKPENLLLASPSDDTSIRLADFGFASSVRDGCLINACGTPGYIAPEMLKNMPYKTVREGEKKGRKRERGGERRCVVCIRVNKSSECCFFAVDNAMKSGT